MGRAQSWRFDPIAMASSAIKLLIRQLVETSNAILYCLDARFPKPLEHAFIKATAAQSFAASGSAIFLLSFIVLLKLIFDLSQFGFSGQGWLGEAVLLALMAACYAVVCSDAKKYFQSYSIYLALGCFSVFVLLLEGDASSSQVVFFGTLLAPITFFVLIMTQRFFLSAMLWCMSIWMLSSIYWYVSPNGLANDQVLMLSLSTFIVSLLGLVAIFALEHIRREQFLSQQHGELTSFSNQELNVARERACFLFALDDQLGIANRTSFERALREEWRRAIRHKYSLALVLVRFEQGSDSIGQMLSVSQVAGAFTQRPGDFIARFDTNTLSLLLVDTDENQCSLLAQRLSEYLAKGYKRGNSHRFSEPSIGYAALQPGPALFTKDLIDRAVGACQGKPLDKSCQGISGQD